MLFSLFTKSEKQKDNERFRLLNQITNTVIGLQQQIQNLEKQRENEIAQTKQLIKNKRNDAAKLRYRNVKNIDELINKVYERVLILERNKLCLIEEEGNRAVYNIMKSINDDYKENKIEIEDVEKELEKNTDAIEDRKELSGVYTSFVAEYDMTEYDDLVNSVSVEENDACNYEKEKQNDIVL
ncbi:hypothetical protein BDAP_000415 [Binucleata daphniae]